MPTQGGYGAPTLEGRSGNAAPYTTYRGDSTVDVHGSVDLARKPPSQFYDEPTPRYDAPPNAGRRAYLYQSSEDLGGARPVPFGYTHDPSKANEAHPAEVPGKEEEDLSSNRYFSAIPLDGGTDARGNSLRTRATMFGRRMYLLSQSKNWMPSRETLKFGAYCLMWYLSSAVTNNIGKLILIQFKYPVTLTFVQFGFVAACCFLFSLVPQSSSRGSALSSGSNSTSGGFAGSPGMARRNNASAAGRQHFPYPRSNRSSLPTSRLRRPTRAVVMTTLPLSIFQIAGHVFSSIAMSRVPVSFVHTIKALSPLFTVLIYRSVYRVKYNAQVYTALLPLTLGVMLACSFEFNTDMLGACCALGSCIIFVSQNIFSKKLLFKTSVDAANAPVVAESHAPIDGGTYGKSAFSFVAPPSGYSHLSSVVSSSTPIGMASGSGSTSYSSLPRSSSWNENDGPGTGDGGLASLGSAGNLAGLNYASPPHPSLGSVATSSSTRAAPHLDKMNLLFYSSFMAFVLMFPLWLYSDGLRFFSTTLETDVRFDPVTGDLLPSSSQPHPPPPIPHSSSSSSSSASASAPSPPITQQQFLPLLLLFTLNGLTHYFQNFFAFSLLSITSPVTYSIASLVKRIFVIVASIIYFGQVVSPVQGFGISATFVGLWMYNSAKRDSGTAELRKSVGAGGGGGGGRGGFVDGLNLLPTKRI